MRMRRLAAALVAFLPLVALPALAQPAQSLIEKGRYLATAADCIACHTTPGGKPFAGGLSFDLGFGKIYSPNITPDPTTGIGRWTDADFLRALQQGVGPNGQHYYPAFPYASYTHLTNADILAIKAYLFSLPPVKSPRVPSTLAFPFNQRWVMRLWDRVFVNTGPLRPQPNRSPEWNRGAYLVEALGHCGECHTPRNSFLALNEKAKFAGANQQGWHAYNITSDKASGLGDWTDDEISAYLSTGHAPGRSTAAGPMAEVVQYSTSKLAPEDIKAIVAYLRTIRPIRNEPPVNPKPPAVTATGLPPHFATDPGAQLFAGACHNCHNWDGTGAQTPYATLVGARTVNDPAATNLVRIVLDGSHMIVGHEIVNMPAFAGAFSDAGVADLARFTTAWFGGQKLAFTPAEIAGRRVPVMHIVPVWVSLWWKIALFCIATLIALLMLIFSMAGPPWRWGRGRDRTAHARG